MMLAADAEHRSLALGRGESVHVKFDDGHGFACRRCLPFESAEVRWWELMVSRVASGSRVPAMGWSGSASGIRPRPSSPTGVAARSASTLKSATLSRTRYARSGAGYLRDIRRLSRGSMSRSTQD
jgi:hypothetical protein